MVSVRLDDETFAAVELARADEPRGPWIAEAIKGRLANRNRLWEPWTGTIGETPEHARTAGETPEHARTVTLGVAVPAVIERHISSSASAKAGVMPIAARPVAKKKTR